MSDYETADIIIMRFIPIPAVAIFCGLAVAGCGASNEATVTPTTSEASTQATTKKEKMPSYKLSKRAGDITIVTLKNKSGYGADFGDYSYLAPRAALDICGEGNVANIEPIFDGLNGVYDGATVTCKA